MQLDNGVKIDTRCVIRAHATVGSDRRFIFSLFFGSNLKCELCDVRENLWLNLTDGSVRCGRKGKG